MTVLDRLEAVRRWRRGVRQVKARQLEETRHARHQVWFGEPRGWHRAWWAVADMFDHAWAKGLLWALFLFALMAGLGSIDYLRSADEVVEDAVIVSVEESDTETVTSCDRFGLLESPAVVVTYRVQESRPGLPDEVLTYECGDYGVEVGDVVPLVRADGVEGEVWTYPVRSWWEVLTFALVGFWPLSPTLVAFVLATAWFALGDEVRATAWYARWEERDHQRELARWRAHGRTTRGHEPKREATGGH